MLLSRRAMLAGLAACSIPTAAGQAGATGVLTRIPTRTMPRRRRLFGAAVRPEQLVPGTKLEQCIGRDCQLLVPEFHGQWSAVEWIPGEPYYGNYDAIVAYARATGKQVRGHSLLWEQMTPDWARRSLGEDPDWAIIRRHFAGLLVRYRGMIGDWVVVNEMIDTEDGVGFFRRNTFQRAFGNGYVARSLELARELDPGARLMINDYSLSQSNPVDARRRSAMLRLVEQLKARGTPLDCVGIQGHLELSKGPVAEKELQAFLAELAGMGVEIAVTELDVLEDVRDLPVAVRDQRVADTVEHFLEVVCGQEAVRSVVTWGLRDSDSWLQEKVHETRVAQRLEPVDCARLNRGLPYDGQMRAKRMLGVIQRMVA